MVLEGFALLGLGRVSRPIKEECWRCRVFRLGHSKRERERRKKTNNKKEKRKKGKSSFLEIFESMWHGCSAHVKFASQVQNSGHNVQVGAAA